MGLFKINFLIFEIKPHSIHYECCLYSWLKSMAAWPGYDRGSETHHFKLCFLSLLQSVSVHTHCLVLPLSQLLLCVLKPLFVTSWLCVSEFHHFQLPAHVLVHFLRVDSNKLSSEFTCCFCIWFHSLWAIKQPLPDTGSRWRPEPQVSVFQKESSLLPTVCLSSALTDAHLQTFSLYCHSLVSLVDDTGRISYSSKQYEWKEWCRILTITKK